MKVATCNLCGVEFMARNSRGDYCSFECSLKDRFGEKNPNFKGAGHKVCIACGAEYKNYHKGRKYCSRECYNSTRKKIHRIPKLKLKSTVIRMCFYCGGNITNRSKDVRTCGSDLCMKAHRESLRGPKPVTPCANCGKLFEHYWSNPRKYCSYECHLESGGAKRAGIAAAMAKNKYGAKKDANHKELVTALEKMGVGVIDTSEKGGGFPDLICAVKYETLLVEIKNPKTRYGQRGLNGNQKKFAEEWTGGPVYIIKDIDDCVLLANLNLDSLYAYGGAAQVNVDSQSAGSRNGRAGA